MLIFLVWVFFGGKGREGREVLRGEGFGREGLLCYMIDLDFWFFFSFSFSF